MKIMRKLKKKNSIRNKIVTTKECALLKVTCKRLRTIKVVK